MPRRYSPTGGGAKPVLQSAPADTEGDGRSFLPAVLRDGFDCLTASLVAEWWSCQAFAPRLLLLYARLLAHPLLERVEAYGPSYRGP
jgi:hypothetical protein